MITWDELRKQTKDFREDKISEILYNGTVYDFSVDHSAIGKENIFNIHECLIKMSNIK